MSFLATAVSGLPPIVEKPIEPIDWLMLGHLDGDPSFAIGTERIGKLGGKWVPMKDLRGPVEENHRAQLVSGWNAQRRGLFVVPWIRNRASWWVTAELLARGRRLDDLRGLKTAN